MAKARVEDIYEQLKHMAVGFELRPGDRLNEGALARDLGVSRTPLREALNRLVTEKLIDFRAGSGFYCRGLEAQTIYDLYELRQIIEVQAVRLACIRATKAGLVALRDGLYRTGLDTSGYTVAEACEIDESFHVAIAELTGNRVLVQQLLRINEQIRFVRWIDMAQRVKATKAEHRAIMEALLLGDADRAGQVMQAHISKRMDQVVDVVKEGFSSIYMQQSDALQSRLIGAV